VAGKANILIFPNLDAGNSAYHLVKQLAHATVYGPIYQGLQAPVVGLAPTATVEDIVTAATIAAAL
jgi:phosphotransacetylase